MNTIGFRYGFTLFLLKNSNIKQGSVSVSNLKVLNRLLSLKVVTIIQSLTVITLRALLCWKDTSKSACLSVFFFNGLH